MSDDDPTTFRWLSGYRPQPALDDWTDLAPDDFDDDRDEWDAIGAALADDELEPLICSPFDDEEAW